MWSGRGDGEESRDTADDTSVQPCLSQCTVTSRTHNSAHTRQPSTNPALLRLQAALCAALQANM